MTDNADIDKVFVFPCRKSIRQFVCSVYVYLEIVSISRLLLWGVPSTKQLQALTGQ